MKFRPQFPQENDCSVGRVQLKRDGTRWRTGGEVKGKLANGVGSQYPSLPRNLVYPALLLLMRTPRLSVVDWTDDPADLNGLVHFAERQNLVSARVPSHFKRSQSHMKCQGLLHTVGPRRISHRRVVKLGNTKMQGESGGSFHTERAQTMRHQKVKWCSPYGMSSFVELNKTMSVNASRSLLTYLIYAVLWRVNQ